MVVLYLPSLEMSMRVNVALDQSRALQSNLLFQRGIWPSEAGSKLEGQRCAPKLELFELSGKGKMLLFFKRMNTAIISVK